ncbi:HNH endonuclease signature motif containing protein [Aliirhizobium cellulosilyticum]|uniref:HNH nuclease domain-containing protein n=1 Tax=Aliirhizobium cellulosilyticum TaxID=393664 RepID=A0A7W6S7X1_9HYPH|nr:hypothetical protein [Rhizobium cellulosilyticum]MBB4409609.1 hypothetical protein [Rhizobium cellulosilyticum]MBB4444297.1 hypothetical protein [Rhizobium cellulosilyticum]
MSTALNLSGRRFGSWYVISETSTRRGASKKPAWLCRCDCGRERFVSASALSAGESRSCGCKKAINRQASSLDRIFDNSIPEPNSGCWIWLGPVQRAGKYGTISIRKRKTGAHRLALMLATGRSGDGLMACHKCDVPACVNPQHLFWGTAKENQQDSISKGRARHFGDGARYVNAKLLESDIPIIRADKRRTIDIARAYGVSRTTIKRIRTRQVWGSVA